MDVVGTCLGVERYCRGVFIKKLRMPCVIYSATLCVCVYMDACVADIYMILYVSLCFTYIFKIIVLGLTGCVCVCVLSVHVCVCINL